MGLLAVQESGGPPLGSPSVLHGNLVGRLHSGKNGGRLHIRTRRARIPPPACQMGLSYRRLLVDMDPTQQGVKHVFENEKRATAFEHKNGFVGIN